MITNPAQVQEIVDNADRINQFCFKLLAERDALLAANLAYQQELRETNHALGEMSKTLTHVVNKLDKTKEKLVQTKTEFKDYVQQKRSEARFFAPLVAKDSSGYRPNQHRKSI